MAFAEALVGGEFYATDRAFVFFFHDTFRHRGGRPQTLFGKGGRRGSPMWLAWLAAVTVATDHPTWVNGYPGAAL